MKIFLKKVFFPQLRSQKYSEEGTREQAGHTGKIILFYRQELEMASASLRR